MNIIELIIDEEAELYGVDALSLVEHPAIESDWVAMKSQEFTFKTQDEEKRIVMGAALIPDKPIYRKSEEEEYYVYFSKKKPHLRPRCPGRDLDGFYESRE